MSNRFDKRTNVFNQNGRISQIEYAIQAINNSSPVMAIRHSKGVVFMTQKREFSKLTVGSEIGEKIYKIDDHLYVIVCGMQADANYLIEQMRLKGQNYWHEFDSPIPIDVLVEQISSVKQAYTQQGGMRPYGCAFIYTGYDRHQQFQLYTSDPSGNFASWKAVAMGLKEEAANNSLQEKYDENISKEQALNMLIKVVGSILEENSPNADKLVIGFVELDDEKEVRLEYLSKGEIERLIKENPMEME